MNADTLTLYRMVQALSTRVALLEGTTVFVVLENLKSNARFYTTRIVGVDPELTVTGERAYRVVADVTDEEMARKLVENPSLVFTML